MRKNLFGFNIIVMIYILSLATGYALFGGSLFVNGTASTVEYYDGVKLPTEPVRLDSVNNTYYIGTELTGIPFSSEEWVDDTYTLNFQKSGDMVPNLKKEQQTSYTVSFTNPTVLSYTDNNIEIEILDDTENEIVSANSIVSKLVVNKGETVDVTFNINTKFTSVNTNNSVKAKISYMLQGSRRYFYFIVNYIGDPNYRKDAVLTTGGNFQKLLNTYKANITEVTFDANTLEVGSYVAMYDISSDGDGTVLGVIKDDSNNSGKYILHIMFDNDIIYGNSDSSNLFYQFSSLTGINNISVFDTSKIVNMYRMFRNCVKLNDLNLSNFNTENVTNMSQIFTNCSILSRLDVSNFNTSNVSEMSAMFYGCSQITELDLTNFDTSKVTNMYEMFTSCKKLESLIISNFNTSNVKLMNEMFQDCVSLKNLDLSNFDTSNVTNMAYMFKNCNKLENLNLSNFNTSKVTNMTFFLSGCANLTELNLSNFNTSKVTNMYAMFHQCSKLRNVSIDNFNTTSVSNFGYMFNGCELLTEINVNVLNTSNAKNMEFMFGNCSALKQLNLRGFDTSKVTNIGYMFYNCTELAELDVSNFNTFNVTQITRMFQNCLKLTSIDLSSFDLTNVTNTDNVFADCQNLTTVYVKTQSDLEKLSSSIGKPDNVVVQLKNA